MLVPILVAFPVIPFNVIAFTLSVSPVPVFPSTTVHPSALKFDISFASTPLFPATYLSATASAYAIANISFISPYSVFSMASPARESMLLSPT